MNYEERILKLEKKVSELESAQEKIKTEIMHTNSQNRVAEEIKKLSERVEDILLKVFSGEEKTQKAINVNIEGQGKINTDDKASADEIMKTLQKNLRNILVDELAQ